MSQHSARRALHRCRKLNSLNGGAIIAALAFCGASAANSANVTAFDIDGVRLYMGENAAIATLKARYPNSAQITDFRNPDGSLAYVQCACGGSAFEITFGALDPGDRRSPHVVSEVDIKPNPDSLTSPVLWAERRQAISKYGKPDFDFGEMPLRDYPGGTVVEWCARSSESGTGGECEAEPPTLYLQNNGDLILKEGGLERKLEQFEKSKIPQAQEPKF